MNYKYMIEQWIAQNMGSHVDEQRDSQGWINLAWNFKGNKYAFMIRSEEAVDRGYWRFLVWCNDYKYETDSMQSAIIHGILWNSQGFKYGI